MFNSREKPKTTMVSQKLPIKTENPKDVEKKKLIKPTTLKALQAVQKICCQMDVNTCQARATCFVALWHVVFHSSRENTRAKIYLCAR